MSLDDSEKNYRSEVSEVKSVNDLSSTGVRTRKKVSVVIQGGIPIFYLTFLEKRGIQAESEKLEDNRYRISTSRATRKALIKALESQYGVMVVDEKMEEVA